MYAVISTCKIDPQKIVSKWRRLPSRLGCYSNPIVYRDWLCSTRATFRCQLSCSNFPGHSVRSVSVCVESDCPIAGIGPQFSRHCEFQSRAFLEDRKQECIPTVVSLHGNDSFLWTILKLDMLSYMTLRIFDFKSIIYMYSLLFIIVTIWTQKVSFNTEKNLQHKHIKLSWLNIWINYKQWTMQHIVYHITVNKTGNF